MLLTEWLFMGNIQFLHPAEHDLVDAPLTDAEGSRCLARRACTTLFSSQGNKSPSEIVVLVQKFVGLYAVYP